MDVLSPEDLRYAAPPDPGHGSASLAPLERKVTDKERARWRREDRERDERRIPLGFRGPA